MAPIYYLLLVQRLYRIRKAFKDFQSILKRKFSYSFLVDVSLLLLYGWPNFYMSYENPFPALFGILLLAI